jgi:CheY-like chemotaxis protein
MPDIKASILIVEDEDCVRAVLAEILTVHGHRVRSAADGLAALIELRREVPDILLSDLTMPGMSGFELLSVVRRRFPGVRVVAMGSTFYGNQIPCGVAADAFYQKSNGLAVLLKVIETLPLLIGQQRGTSEPIWIQRNGHDASGEEFVTIACPDCFRTFPQSISGTPNLIQATRCVFCRGFILYGIVEPLDPEFPQHVQPAPSFAIPGIRAADLIN